MKSRVLLLLFVAITITLSSCQPTIEYNSIELIYDGAMEAMDKGSYDAAITQFDKIIQQSPGTRYAIHSYLKKGDALMVSNKNLADAEANYRIFLHYASNSHLIPYVLGRIIEANYMKNHSLVFGDEYLYTRDPQRFKNVIAEHQRFFLLYPDSLYLKKAEKYLDLSITALAEHERIIGDWYYDHQQYTAAISRYRYILIQYPNYQHRESIRLKLIQTYRRNQQPTLAEELEKTTGAPS